MLNCLSYLLYGPEIGTVATIKGFIIANVSTIVCFYIFANINPFYCLVCLGLNTLPIYVMHCFFTGGLRVVFKHLSCTNIYLYFFLGTLMGIIVPILTAKLSKNNPYLKVFFEPLKSLKELGVVKG